MTGDGADQALAAMQQVTISQAEYDALLADRARLEYLENQRLRSQKRGGGPFGWDSFNYRTTPDAGTVREQIDLERN